MQTFELRGGNLDFMKYRGPEICLVGMAGSGKTVAGLLKMHLRALSVPGYRGAILRQTHTSLTSSTLASFEALIVREAMAEGFVKWFGGSGRMPPAYRYNNGSVIIVGGLDQPGKLLSVELTDALVDEAVQISNTAYETVSSRLRHSSPTYKQMITLTNPSHPSHHLKVRANEDRLRMVNSTHLDNPRFTNRDGTLTPDGIEYGKRLDTLTGVRRARFRDGLWLAADGQVWDGWSDAVHVVDPFPVPEDGTWRWVESVDFGFQHPMTWGRFAIDPDGRAFLVAEMSRRQRLVEDFAKDILELRKTNGWGRPEALVTDHAAGDRATLERYLGEATVKARKGVSQGIQAVAQRLVVQADGKPRFQVFRNSLIRNDPLAASDKMPRGFVAEVGGYVWETVRGTDGVPKESPVKINDDAADMVRYAIMYLDGAPPAKIGNPAAQRTESAPQGGKWSRPVGR